MYNSFCGYGCEITKEDLKKCWCKKHKFENNIIYDQTWANDPFYIISECLPYASYAKVENSQTYVVVYDYEKDCKAYFRKAEIDLNYIQNIKGVFDMNTGIFYYDKKEM